MSRGYEKRAVAQNRLKAHTNMFFNSSMYGLPKCGFRIYGLQERTDSRNIQVYARKSLKPAQLHSGFIPVLIPVHSRKIDAKL